MPSETQYFVNLCDILGYAGASVYLKTVNFAGENAAENRYCSTQR